MILSIDSQLGVVLLCGGHLLMAGDIFDWQTGGGKESGTGICYTSDNKQYGIIEPKMSIVVRLRNL